MAIFGLILFLSGIYLDITSKDSINESFNELDNNIYQYEFQTEKLTNKLDKLKKEVVNHENKDAHNDDNHVKIINELKRISETFGKLNENKIQDELIRSSAMMNIEKRQTHIYYGLALFLTGLLLISIGFNLWYERYQKYYDAEKKWNGEKYIKLLREKKELKDKLAQKENQPPSSETN